MYKLAIPNAAHFMEKPYAANKTPPGYLLINTFDEIIYANKQARHFLGLMADDALPAGQQFLALVRSAYQCYPSFAWLDWLKRPSPTTIRYLISFSHRNASFSLLKVEIVDNFVVEGGEVWAVAINYVEPSVDATAVIHPTDC